MHLPGMNTHGQHRAHAELAVFSCDIFDTLLLRRCTDPEGVFERTFELAKVAAPYAHMREAFVQHRQMAEITAREQTLAATGRAEVTIEDIYARFPTRVFGLPHSDRPRLARLEFAAEMELCFANPAIQALFQDMRGAGLRCGFLSDTYWNAEQLSRLLEAAVPGLTWDFLYPSCVHGVSKANGLFKLFLAHNRLSPHQIMHVGDHPVADGRVPAKLGIRAQVIPQASGALAAILEREGTTHRLLHGRLDRSARLDGGLRSLRRVIAPSTPETSVSAYGTQVIGPIMTAFDRFIADRVTRQRAKGGRVALAFVGRDGFLPHAIWSEHSPQDGHYVEINRRIAVLASACTGADLAGYLAKAPQIDLAATQGFLKADLPVLHRYFQSAKDGIVRGEDFAKALPEMLDDQMVAALAAPLRTEVMTHLRGAIPDFDTYTDLILVDLGYAGTVQRKLRRILDQEGCKIALHGLYLITEDVAFDELSETDSAEGFLSDMVISHYAKRGILLNISMLEQICSAPLGPAAGYGPDGRIDREPDPRPRSQLDLCADIRRGAMNFAKHYLSERNRTLPACLDTPADSAPWIATILARATQLPTDDELAWASALQQHINLGGQGMTPLVDTALSRTLLDTRSVPAACKINQPATMWPAAGMASQAPRHAFDYLLFGLGLLPGEIAGEAPCGQIALEIVDQQGRQRITTTALRTGDGALRLRIPFPTHANPKTVRIPASALPSQGLLAIALQTGDTPAQAMAEIHAQRDLALETSGDGIILDGPTYTVTGPDGALAIQLPPLTRRIAVLTVTIGALSGTRVLALNG